MKDTKHWITKLVPAIVFIAGVAMVAVGGVMTVSSSLKLAFFETEPYDYYNSEACTFDYSRPVLEGEKTLGAEPYRLTPEEAEICKAEKEAEAKERFQNLEKQDIVDGISSLLVGGILLLVFRKRK